MNDARLSIIRGASGSGKSTVLQHLRQMLVDAFLVDIDSVREQFSNMDWNNGFTDYVNAQKIVKAMVAEAIRLGYKKVVVADTFPKELLMSFIDGIGCTVDIISLYCDPDELVRRLEKRGRPIFHKDRIIAMNGAVMIHDLDVEKLPEVRAIYFDNTSKDEYSLDIFFQKP